MKKILCLILSLLMVLPFVAACEADVELPQDTEVTTAAEEVVTEDPLFVKDELPSDLNFNGEAITWSICFDKERGYDDFCVEEDAIGADTVSMAIFQTGAAVEDRLNIVFDFVYTPYTWDTRATDYRKICSDIEQGVGEFELVTSMSGLLLYSAARTEPFYNIQELPYISLEKPWYSQNIANTFSGKQYYVTGDAHIGSLKRLGCVYFNQDYLDARNVEENIYDIVHAGEWTLEKMQNLTKDMYVSVDGTNSRLPDDSYGITFCDTNAYTPFIESMGITFYEKNGSGAYVYNANSERNIDIMTKLKAFVNDYNYVFCDQNAFNDSEYRIQIGGRAVDKMFAQEQSAFVFAEFNDAKWFRALELKCELGLAPYPKYEAADDYHITEMGLCTWVPKSSSNKDMSAAVLEAWSSEMYRTTVPTYFEQTLQLRYSENSQMSEMFDLIRNSRTISVNSFLQDPENMTMGASIIKLFMVGHHSWTGVEWSSYSAANKSSSIAQLKRIGTKYGFEASYS